MAGEFTFRDVTLGYDRHPAVHHLDGEIAQGSLLAIVGPNGAGKSTLLRGIAGLIKPLSGEIVCHSDAHEIAYLPQISEIDRSFPISVFDFAALGLWRSQGLFGGFTAHDDQAVEAALAAVGLNGFEARAVGTLSGGQMQRMLFARVILQNARIIVLDEPLNAVDSKTSADLVQLIRRWHTDGRTVIAAVHDFELVRTTFPDTLLLARSVVGWGATAAVLTATNLTAAQQMCEAFDEGAAPCAASKAA